MGIMIDTVWETISVSRSTGLSFSFLGDSDSLRHRTVLKNATAFPIMRISSSSFWMYTRGG